MRNAKSEPINFRVDQGKAVPRVARRLPRKHFENNSLKIAGIYCLIGFLWVLLSDGAVNFGVQDRTSAALVNLAKGLFFVMLSGGLILMLVHSAINKQKSIQNQLNRSLSELKEAENFRKVITEKMLNAYILHRVVRDEAGNPCDYEFVEVNDTFVKFTGLSKENIIGKRFQEVITKKSDAENWNKNFRHVALTGEPLSLEAHVSTFDRWISVNMYLPQEGYVAVVFNDITEIKNREDELREKNEKLASLYAALSTSEEELRQQYNELSNYQKQIKISDERYKLAIEGANDIIWDIDFTNNHFYISERSLDVLGYDQSEFVLYGQQYTVWFNLVHPDDQPNMVKLIQKYLKGSNSFFRCEVRFLSNTFEYKWFLIRGKALYNSSGTPVRLAGSMTDIDQRKRDELQLKKSYRELESTNGKLHDTQNELQKKYDELQDYQKRLQEFAYSDSLTGLPNRLALNENLPLLLKQSPKDKLALFFIDSDNFKLINDTMGHSFGDELIIAIGKKLMSLLDSQKKVYRLGGDEFIILYSGYSNLEQVYEFAHAILKSFVKPLSVGTSTLYTTVSIGISTYPQDGADSDALMKHADIAMYKAKALGKNDFILYNSNMDETIQMRMLIEKHLRGALQNNEFLLYYQPQMDIDTKRITGFEALLRWNNPTLGMITPSKFIGLAEETHLIIDIGEWVLRESCLFLRQLHKKGFPDLMISVNISIIQLIQDNFVEKVYHILKEADLPARYLELEITESILMESFRSTNEKLNQLKKRGIKIALDDFGQGYSSLSYLRQLPIDTLKIDKTFIDDILNENCETCLTGTIIDIGRSMGMSVIAEGVEKQEQFDYLTRHKCQKIQGFLVSEPLPADQAEKLLTDRAPDHPCSPL